MQGQKYQNNQQNLFKSLLVDMLNPQHPLLQLAERIPWRTVEQWFSHHYSHTGRPSKPIRLMVGLLVLKQLYNLSDERVVSLWQENPYFQYFCGESEFQWHGPCDPSDLVHFRHRIGPEGAERLLELSVLIQSEASRSADVLVDTTVQQKNITYPSDSKLYQKVLKKVRQIAQKEGIQLRQSYRRVVKGLLYQIRIGHRRGKKKQSIKALKKLKTIAGRAVRDVHGKLTQEQLQRYADLFCLFERVLSQQPKDKNKLYSLHEPEVSCIAKGKAHKRYEFGSKVSLAVIPGQNLIVGVQVFRGNPYDGHTLEPTLEHAKKITGRTYNNAIVDLGYRGINQVGKSKLIRPEKRPNKSRSQKQRLRKKCRSRSAIEAVIGHLKSDFRMLCNYLKGTAGDDFNATMATAAFNFKRWIRITMSMDTSFLLFLFFGHKITYPHPLNTNMLQQPA